MQNRHLSVSFCNYLYSLLLASSDLQVFSGAQGQAGAMVNQTVTPASLTQPAQVCNITQFPVRTYVWYLPGVILCYSNTFVSEYKI